MKILVTYFSQTGNTQKIAEAIFETLTFPKTLKRMEDVNNPEDYDLIFAGFPIWQFGPAKPARQFFSGLKNEQPIAIFITHAMDPAPVDPDQLRMLNGILEKCRNLAKNTTLKGLFHCRGELSHETAIMLVSSGIPILEKFAGLRSETSGHPDENDLQNARNFCSGILQLYRE